MCVNVGIVAAVYHLAFCVAHHWCTVAIQVKLAVFGNAHILNHALWSANAKQAQVIHTAGCAVEHKVVHRVVSTVKLAFKEHLTRLGGNTLEVGVLLQVDVVGHHKVVASVCLVIHVHGIGKFLQVGLVLYLIRIGFCSLAGVVICHGVDVKILVVAILVDSEQVVAAIVAGHGHGSAVNHNSVALFYGLTVRQHAPNDVVGARHGERVLHLVCVLVLGQEDCSCRQVGHVVVFQSLQARIKSLFKIPYIC